MESQIIMPVMDRINYLLYPKQSGKYFYYNGKQIEGSVKELFPKIVTGTEADIQYNSPNGKVSIKVEPFEADGEKCGIQTILDENIYKDGKYVKTKRQNIVNSYYAANKRNSVITPDGKVRNGMEHHWNPVFGAMETNLKRVTERFNLNGLRRSVVDARSGLTRMQKFLMFISQKKGAKSYGQEIPVIRRIAGKILSKIM